MIDPKLNEIPVEGRTVTETQLTDAEKAERLKRSRSGLSINDTIAGDTLLSSGSRGVDTSGVSAGAGAGAGSSTVTPVRANESPAPNVVPGAQGSGTTVRAAVNTAGAAGSTTTSAPTEAASSVSNAAEPNTMDVAERAYQIWYSRGCPEGTAEEDWHQAERELRTERTGTLTRTAAR